MASSPSIEVVHPAEGWRGARRRIEVERDAHVQMIAAITWELSHTEGLCQQISALTLARHQIMLDACNESLRLYDGIIAIIETDVAEKKTS